MAGAAGGFVTRAFESMQKECATNTKKFAPLHKSIQSYLDNIKGIKQEPPATDASQTENEVKENSISIIETLASAGNTLEGTQAEIVLQPLRLAFESKNIKLIDPALDCLHKLIAYDHLEGDPGVEGGKNAPLFTDILNMVCGCVDNTTLDSTILQVLKVLLTAVASNKFRVHGEPLLAVIKVCYDIALNSKSPINQATSKAMLTQMISIVFRRMETDQVQAPGSMDESSSSTEKKESENNEITNTEGEKEEKEEVTTLGDALSISNVTEASPASVEELQNLAGGADIKGLEAVLDKAVQLEDGKKVIRGIDLESLSIAHRDALLMFRTLCKMGMKEESDEVTTKTRLLSLELLQGLLEGVSGSFTKNFHFIDSVKAYLSYALLRACVSSSPVVFQYASGIFSVLLLRFRESLKGEIGVFFPLVVIRSLDSSDTPLTQRASVLRMLEKVCKDSQMLADLFVNYDCDLEAPNLYERMVNALSKIAQGTINADPNSVTATQANSVKGSSLQCLVSIIKSLVDWEKAKREITKQNSEVESVENEDISSSSLKERSTEEGLSHFEKAKAHKSTLETAVSEFNRKPSKGIEYLLSNKLVENTPSSVAQFLKNTPTLNKVMVGEYLGQHEEFPLAVMHAYVESMKFSGMKFDSAIREFLKGFRLPGEAQKIDRIMEKFAERYCADNPGLFKTADTAYILAYAVIMLNTDAHNPMVFPKMSKSDFIRMNSSDPNDQNAPVEMLEQIYDSITVDEIKMKDENALRGVREKGTGGGGIVDLLNLALPRSGGKESKEESERIVKMTQEVIRSQGGKRGVFYTAEQVELVRPMLDAVGWPLLATFSVTMEEGESKPRVVLCMEGFKAGIHLTRVLGMDTMRYAFLTSLIRFTFLHAPKQLRTKNVEALRTLLSLADTETDSLADTWNALLECVSRLDHITNHPSVTQTVMQGSNQISREAVVQGLKELAGKPSEQVFVNSVKLRSNTIVEFFTALCSVSNEELKQNPPRVFSLQKLVEISYYNMARIRMVWAQIWTVLSAHFITAGSHPDEKVAMYAIDSLRQLGMKYLERAELNKFTFQNDILKPFVVLMRNSRNDKIRGLIVDCIVQLIKSKVGSIKSGWKSVFMIFTSASSDSLEPIVESAFENVEQVILEHFDQVVADCFMDCVNCLIGFANNKTSGRISLKAIALLRICEDRLAEGFIPGGALKPLSTLNPSDPSSTFDITEHYWFPMLAGLSDLTLDPRAEIRSCALEVLFDLLNERGHKFSSAFWESIFQRVLFPIFDHVRMREGEEGEEREERGEEWVRETSIHSLQLVCNLFNTFYNEVSFMLPPLLELLLDCAKKTDQTVVSIALGALVHLIEVGGHRFSDADWDTLLKSIRDALYTTQPLELLNSVGFEKSNNADVSNSDAETSELNLNSNSPHSYQETTANSEGLSSPSAKTPTGSTVSPRNPSFSQRFMDNILLRNLTSKSRAPAEETLASSSLQEQEAGEGEKTEEEEEEVSPVMDTVRSKCITQLLLLGAINSIQVKYWNKLNAAHKVAIMDVLMSLLEFAASYNSPSSLRIRMNHMSTERPPVNLLRQEISGTTIYLEILHKSTNSSSSSDEGLESEYEKIRGLAEEKLVTFCNNVLKEASDLQPGSGESAGFDIHRVLSLRAPIIVMVLKGMSRMDGEIFKRHLRDFYPLITKLICCDQMEVRGALGDLFTTQLTGLMPKLNNAVHAF